jgi:glycosyltransferase involved in cell wall biosynthesis
VRYAFYWSRSSARVYHTLRPEQYPSVSIIIAARNEETVIARTLHRLTQAKYPSTLEILVIDDHSTDHTAREVLSFSNSSIRLLANAGQGKRAALDTGIRQAVGEIILLTDADCLPESCWVAAMVSQLMEKNTRWVSGPVLVIPDKGMVGNYDALESHGMMVITGATFEMGFPELAQGASIGFFKDDFIRCGGYDDFPDRASGDDVLLLDRFQHTFPGKCRFVHDKNAIVYTHAPSTWKSLIGQRFRWTSKAGKMQNGAAKLKMILVYVMSWAVLLFMLGLPFWNEEIQTTGFIVIGLKCLAEGILLGAGLRFTQQWKLMGIFIPALLIHPLLVVLAGSIGPFRKSYQWKDRKVR